VTESHNKTGSERPPCNGARIQQQTILAVDDTEDSLELIREALTSHDFNVVCASSGPEAVQILRNIRPVAVVLDIMMPDMNGFALLEIIREMPGLQDVPVLLQTANPSREHGQRTVDSNLTYMLAKPLDVDLLVRAVKECIQAKVGS